MRHVRGTLRGVGTVLLCAGVLVALFPLMTEGYGRHRQRVLRREFLQQVVAAPVELGAQRKVVRLPFRLVIPKIWVDVIVKQGVDGKTLASAPVHYPGTALPGEEGNCVVSGHRVTYGSPFHWLDRLGPGDGIATQTSDGWIWYVVTEVKIIQASRLADVIFGPTDTRLTLLTCNPLFSAKQRIIVVAKPGTPSDEGKRWAVAPLPKRARASEQEKQGNSPYLRWLQEQAEEGARPLELDFPTSPPRAIGDQQSRPLVPRAALSPQFGGPEPTRHPDRNLQVPAHPGGSPSSPHSAAPQGVAEPAAQGGAPASQLPSALPAGRDRF